MKPTIKTFRFSKPSTAHSPANQARRAVLRRIQRQELRKLQALIPSPMSRSSSNRSLDACTVIEDTIRYIDQLHATVLARIQAGTLPQEVLTQLSQPELMVRLQMQQNRRPSQTGNQVRRVLSSNNRIPAPQPRNFVPKTWSPDDF